MSTNFTTSTVSAGEDIFASEYNNLRQDIIKNAGDFDNALGTLSVYALNIDSAITQYDTGSVFKFRAITANTGSSQLNVNGLGAKTIKKYGDLDLEANDIKAGQLVLVEYDGTNLQMLNNPINGDRASGSLTRTTAAGSGTVNVAHGLAQIPKFVQVFAGEAGNQGGSIGMFITSTNFCTYFLKNQTGSEIPGGVDNANVLKVQASTGAGWSGTLTVDGTNLNFVLTANSATSDLAISWIAWY